MKKFTASIQQMEESIANQNQANKDKEDGFKVKKRTLDLLPDAENNIAKLQVSELLRKKGFVKLYCNSELA